MPFPPSVGPETVILLSIFSESQHDHVTCIFLLLVAALGVSQLIRWLGEGGGKPLSQEVILRQSQCLNSPPTTQWDRTACVITSRADNSSVPYSGVSGDRCGRSPSSVLRHRHSGMRCMCAPPAPPCPAQGTGVSLLLFLLCLSTDSTSKVSGTYLLSISTK